VLASGDPALNDAAVDDLLQRLPAGAHRPAATCIARICCTARGFDYLRQKLPC
jgi:hypothetical protein